MKTINTLMALILVSSFGCRTQNSEVAFSDDVEKQILDAIGNLDEAQRKAICEKQTLVVFVGNKERVGQDTYVAGVVESDNDKKYKETMHQDFMNSIDVAHQSLATNVANGGAFAGICERGNNIGLLSIIDGPGVGDSLIQLIAPGQTAVHFNKEAKRVSGPQQFELSLNSDFVKLLEAVFADDSQVAASMPNKRIDHVVYIFKTHGGIVRLANGELVNSFLFDSNSSSGANLSTVYFKNLHVSSDVKRFCESAEGKASEAALAFCRGNRALDPRMSGVGNGTGGVGNGTGGVGNGTGGVGNGTGGVGNGTGGVGNGTGGVGNGTGGVGNGTSGNAGGEGGGNGTQSISDGNLELGMPNFANANLFSAAFDYQKSQGAMQMAKGLYYAPAIYQDLEKAGMSRLQLFAPKGSEEPIMVILDSCMQSGKVGNAFEKVAFGAPVYAIFSSNPIYYHLIDYKYMQPPLLKFISYLKGKHVLRFMDTFALDTNNLEKMYHQDSSNFVKDYGVFNCVECQKHIDIK